MRDCQEFLRTVGSDGDGDDYSPAVEQSGCVSMHCRPRGDRPQLPLSLRPLEWH